MLPRHQVRRLEARHMMRRACSEGRRYTLTDPLFNLREITKQLVLLEDHLTHPYKLCPDCVRKHLLTIEGLAEETTALDRTGIFHEVGEGLAEQARLWIEAFEDNRPPKELALEVRDVRKNMAPFCSDPRGVETRIASLWLQRRAMCPHRMATSPE